ncbi:hypothetical protein [Blautia sp. MSJ-19]|uniref:hypothetical protein n=1 Tax=Blautia sp. MSJ-19 TaxID=2841517 RepID=UPI001C0F11CC|nr:hypothetical protein [Blautia sp. MSJ-19]MBU5480517.1 hypothetical protein [Blautia sp. MSJ-19]
MDTDVNQLKRSFTRAVLWILLLLAVATGSTYAWFSLTGINSTNVTPMGGTVSKGDAVLLISTSQTGPFDKTCELVLSGNPDSLKPLSTENLEHFFRAAAQNKNGITTLYTNADSRVDQDAVHGTVYLQCQNAPCKVYFNKENLKLGSDAQALAAMRLGMKVTSHEGSRTYIWKLDEMGSTGSAETVQTISRSSAVVSSISDSGQPTYADDPSQEISQYMAQTGETEGLYQDGSQMLMQLDADEIATVEYWLYLEGCDEQCVNAVQNRDSELQLAFAGVDTEESGRGE